MNTTTEYGPDNKLAVEAVLFDMDGTLLDTIGLIVYGHETTWKAFGGEIPTREMILSLVGRPLQEAYPADKAEEMVAYYRRACEGKTDTHTGVFLGIVPMLEELKQMGFRLGLVTSRYKVSLWDCMRVHKLDPYFEILLSQEDSEGHKPGPEPMLAAAEHLSISDMSRILYVGDSVHDVMSAKAAGCYSAVVDWTHMDKEALRALHPSLWIYNALDLPKSLSLLQ